MTFLEVAKIIEENNDHWQNLIQQFYTEGKYPLTLEGYRRIRRNYKLLHDLCVYSMQGRPGPRDIPNSLFAEIVLENRSFEGGSNNRTKNPDDLSAQSGQ